MFVKQLSVFLENTEGRLDEVLKILAQGGIDLLSASLADTMEYGVLRLLAKDPDKAKQILKDAGFAARIDEVIAVVVPDAVGSLAKVVGMIHAAGINISYIYGSMFFPSSSSQSWAISDAIHWVPHLRSALSIPQSAWVLP